MNYRDGSAPAAVERRSLVRALREKGPAAATLCQGWNTHDLAVHVVARDSRPDIIFGQGLPVVAGQAERAYQRFEQLAFHTLLDRIEAGPPQWSPARLPPVGDAINTLEFFVHTEDVLRAGPEAEQEPRRSVTGAVRAALWRQASRTLFVAAARKARRRITYLSPGVGAVTYGRSSDPLRILEGPPEELVLWAFGRQEAADVAIRSV